MKRLLIPFVVAVCAVAGATDSVKWSSFQSPAGRYSVSFPGTPMNVAQPLETKVGKVVMRMSMLEDGRRAGYIAAYCDFPSNLVARTDKQYLLDCFTKGVAGRGTVKSQRSLSLSGYPGRELTVTARGVNTTRRVYIRGNRVYIAGYVWKADSSQPAGGKRFFDSFRIL